MPPKRPLSNTNANANDYQSPPPGRRNAHENEQHHSPMPGHHQETPVDAPVAIATPPRVHNNNENLAITGAHSPDDDHTQAAGAAIPISHPATADAIDLLSTTAATAEIHAAPPAVPEPVPPIGGGARAAVMDRIGAIGGGARAAGLEPVAAGFEPVAAIGGGARAAYQTSQQQRVITCNLTNIPLSE
jgi:hypothetical protein